MTDEADVEQVLLEAMAEKLGLQVEHLQLIGAVLGIDDAIAYAKEEAFEIAKRAESCTEYTLAGHWQDFLANGNMCIESIEADIYSAVEDAVRELMSGKWL